MSRTVKQVGAGRRWYSKESKENRKALHRLRRAQQRDAISTEKFDDVPRPRGTQGWMTH